MTQGRSLMMGAIALVALIGAGQVQAQDGDCRLVVETGAEEWRLEFDPLDQDAALQTFDLAVVNQGQSTCVVRPRVNLRGESFGLMNGEGGGRLDYVLFEERAGVDVTPRAGLSARRSGGRALTVAPGERSLLRFSFGTRATETLAAGRYSQSAFIDLETEDGQVEAERPVTLSVEVPRVALMGLKGEFRREGGLTIIDVGELSQGARPLGATLYVVSTGGYSISVTSQNQGRLTQGGGWFVPYALTLGGQAVDLSGEGRREVLSHRPRLDDYPLAIVVGETAGKRAGEYRDVLTFTVAAI
ncbi:hypothetical protein [Brevundimonas naejangsanensis]|uniref:hypothetical protein n=2 Tax=Brevundimonas TaxID=41275 RepID=UPI0026C626D4